MLIYNHTVQSYWVSVWWTVLKGKVWHPDTGGGRAVLEGRRWWQVLRKHCEVAIQGERPFCCVWGVCVCLWLSIVAMFSEESSLGYFLLLVHEFISSTIFMHLQLNKFLLCKDHIPYTIQVKIKDIPSTPGGFPISASIHPSPLYLPMATCSMHFKWASTMWQALFLTLEQVQRWIKWSMLSSRSELRDRNEHTNK